MQSRSWPATAARLARAVAFAGLAGLTTPAQARTADPQALLEALAPVLGADCALANPLPAGAEVLAAMGAPAAWGAFCPAEGRAVLAAEMPAAAGRWLETLAMQLLVANGNRPVSLADLAGKTLIQVSAGPGGTLAIDRAPLPDPARLPGLLFDGTESPDWLPQAFSGGSFQDFARYDGQALVVDVPQGHGWGVTGIYSAAPVVPVPDVGAPAAVRLRFDIDPEATTAALFSLVPPQHAGKEDWGTHDLRLAYVEPEGEPAMLMVHIRQREVGRYVVTDKAVLKDLSLWLRPDRSLAVIDATGRVLIQAPLADLTAGMVLHLYAEVGASNPDHAIRMRLHGIRMDLVPMDLGPDPTAPLGDTPETAVLFDGTHYAGRFDPIWAHGGDFARDARVADGALRVAAAEGHGWGKAGLYSPDPVVWLDRFTEGAEVRLSVDFDAAATTGFVLALSGSSTLFGNDPSNPRFLLYWRKDADGVTRVLRVVDYDRDKLEIEVPQGMPDRLELVMTPMGIQLLAPGFPDEVLPWALLTEGQGLRLSLYSQSAAENLPSAMAVKRIALTRTPGRAPGEPVPGVGAEPLPEKTLFAGQADPAWVPFSLVWDKTFDALARFQDGWLVAEVPAIGGWGRVGLLSDKPLVTLDRRIEVTPYRLRFRLDPARTDGFATLLSTARVEDMWGARSLHADLTRMIRGPQAGRWKLTLDTGRGSWTRYIDPVWLAAHWDGRLEVDLGPEWARVSLPGGVSIGGSAPFYAFGEYFAVIESLGAGDYDGARMAISGVTGGYVTPRLMDPVQRLLLLDDADFDPAAFVDLLGSSLSEDLP